MSKNTLPQPGVISPSFILPPLSLTTVLSVLQDVMLCNFLLEQLKHPSCTTRFDPATDVDDKSPSRAFPAVTGISLSTCCHTPSPCASYTFRWSWNTPSWIHLSILGAIARLNFPSVIINRRSMKSSVATTIENTVIRPSPNALMVLQKVSWLLMGREWLYEHEPTRPLHPQRPT